MKKFFERSFTVLSLVSFAIGIYFLVRREEVFAYAYSSVGCLLTLVAALIEKVSPEEE